MIIDLKMNRGVRMCGKHKHHYLPGSQINIHKSAVCNFLFVETMYWTGTRDNKAHLNGIIGVCIEINGNMHLL